MPIGEPQPGQIPDSSQFRVDTRPPTPVSDLKTIMGIAEITHETALTLPQTAESSRNAANGFAPIAGGLVDALLAGNITREEAIAFLVRDKANTSEAANMDDLSETYRRDHFERSLNRIIANLPPGKTIRVKFYDLVNFKNVNDALTQAGGDRVLKEAARKFKSLHPADTGGRIGDEFVYFEVVDKPKVENGSNTETPDDMPEKLVDIEARGGNIPVYIHKGVAQYDPVLDKQRVEEKDINGRRERTTISPARSLINRANEVADQNKEQNKAKHPELYLSRQAPK